MNWKCFWKYLSLRAPPHTRPHTRPRIRELTEFSRKEDFFRIQNRQKTEEEVFSEPKSSTTTTTEKVKCVFGRMVLTMLSRRWADDVEDDEENETGGWTSEDLEELSEKLYPETESLRDVERFLSSLEAENSAASAGVVGEEGKKGQKKRLEEARDLLAKVETITRVELPIQIRARKAAARAQIINYLDEGNHQVLEKAFIDAVKLDPDNVQCWNGAAKALWTKGDLQSAHLCYQRSLEHKPGKEAYQSLSMLQRQLAQGEKQAEKKQRTLESVTSAKAAVSLDVQDGESWHLLGNAYLVLAFCVASNERDELIYKSLKTYKHAMKLHKNANGEEDIKPDLKFNYGVVCKYQEQYLEALKSFDYCERVDQTLCANGEKDEITHILSQLTTLIHTKCGLKAKRIAKIQENVIVSPFLLLCFFFLFLKYDVLETNVYTYERKLSQVANKANASTAKLMQFVSLGDLKLGQNSKKMVLPCSVIYSVPVASAVPLVYVCMDSQGNALQLSLPRCAWSDC